MNAIQKAGFAVSALAITIVGAVLVTAPMAFGRPLSVLGQNACSNPTQQIALAGHETCNEVTALQD